MRLMVEKFTKQWNDDPENRDKTISVLQELTQTKEEFQNSLKLMLERDGKIEESLAKGADLVVATTVFKKQAVQVKEVMSCREKCTKYGGTVLILLLVGLFMFWIITKFN